MKRFFLLSLVGLLAFADLPIKYNTGNGDVPDALNSQEYNFPAGTTIDDKNPSFKEDFDANTVLAADTDDTPAAVTVPEDRILGRILGGNIGPLTAAEVLTLINVAAGAEVNPDVVSQAEAEAGTATTERIWTAERVKQAIDSLTPGGGSVDAFTVVTFSGDGSAVNEDAASSLPVEVVLWTTEDTTEEVTVDIVDLLDGTATSGIDYDQIFTPVSLSFPIGSSSGDAQSFLLTFLSDSDQEDAESINLRLRNVSGNSAVLAGTAFTALIVDDDGGGIDESGIEAVVDLEDLQGAVTDGQVPASFTRDTEWDTLAEINAASTDTDAVLDTDIGSTVQAYSAVLDATTASFLTADETKLDGIEALADITDTANVTSAGALMDSEVDADLKTLVVPASTTVSAFGATLTDDASATAARATLDVEQAKLSATIFDPNAAFDIDADICLVVETDVAITIETIKVTCDANPTAQLDWDLYFADAFIGMANQTLVRAMDTTAGVLDTSSGFNDATVPAGKAIYAKFATQPEAAMTQVSIQIVYTID